MKSDNSSGFTLIELLVGMNLGFVTVTLIISLYLLFIKFSMHFINGIEVRQNIQETVYRIDNLLKMNEYFFVEFNDSLCRFSIDNSKYLSFYKNLIEVDGIKMINGLDRISISILQKTGDKILIQIGEKSDGDFGQFRNHLISTHIKSILIEISKDNRCANIFYSPGKFNAKGFENNAELIFN